MANFVFLATFNGWVEVEVDADDEDEARELVHEEFNLHDAALEHLDYELIESPSPLQQLAEQAE